MQKTWFFTSLLFADGWPIRCSSVSGRDYGDYYGVITDHTIRPKIQLLHQTTVAHLF